MVDRIDLQIIVEIVDTGWLWYKLESFYIQTGKSLFTTAIADVHFLRREVTDVFRFVTAALGRYVDEWLVEIGQEFEICVRNGDRP